MANAPPTPTDHPGKARHAPNDNPWPRGHGTKDRNGTFTPGHQVIGGGTPAPVVPFAVTIVRCNFCGFAYDSAEARVENAIAEVRPQHRCAAPDLIATPYPTEAP